MNITKFDIRRGALVASAAVLLLAFVSPSLAGEWQYAPDSDMIYYGSVPVARWSGEGPSTTPEPPRFRVQVPRCPHALCGYPIPIYKARRPSPTTWNLDISQSAHTRWCAARYRSYDGKTDTYQPYHGPRRTCMSPHP